MLRHFSKTLQYFNQFTRGYVFIFHNYLIRDAIDIASYICRLLRQWLFIRLINNEEHNKQIEPPPPLYDSML